MSYIVKWVPRGKQITIRSPQRFPQLSEAIQFAWAALDWEPADIWVEDDLGILVATRNAIEVPFSTPTAISRTTDERAAEEEHGEYAALREILSAESSDGRAVLCNPANNPVCSVTIDESMPCVIVTWHRYATSPQLRFILAYILSLVRDCGIDRILGDDTELRAIHADDQKWIVETWLPRAIKAGLRVGAAKRSSHYFGQISVERIQRTASRAFALRIFEDICDARAWLKTIPPSG